MTADVLIVGAGPVGLTTAAELARRGVRVRIVDLATGPSSASKAIGIHARTLEALEALGVADRLVGLGVELRAFQFHERGRAVAELSFEGLPTRYPFALSLGQDVTERILLGRLRSAGVEVEWGTHLERLVQGDDRVDAQLARDGGDVDRVTSRWVVGCDGASSTVRRQAGVAFDGEPFPEWFLVADLRVDADLDADRSHLFLSQAGATAVFPLPEPGMFRIATPVGLHGRRDEAGRPPELDLADIQRLWQARVGVPARLSDPQWISPFRFQSRLAATYRVKRVLLAGDAAHVHSPVGGQGMNAGIQDAVNLAWKLAAVCRGAPDDLLDSYERERRPVAARILTETRRSAVAVSSDSTLIRGLRNVVLRLVAEVDPVRMRALSRVSMLSVSYAPETMPGPTPSVALNARLRRVPSVGERAPDAPLAGGDAIERVHDLLRSPTHVLLCFDGGSERMRVPHDGLAGRDVRAVRVHRGPARPPDRGAARSEPRPASVRPPPALLDPGGAAHQAYGVRGPAAVLIRPDGVIAWRGGLPPTSDLGEVLVASVPRRAS